MARAVTRGRSISSATAFVPPFIRRPTLLSLNL